jgi:hypothetical protein
MLLPACIEGKLPSEINLRRRFCSFSLSLSSMISIFPTIPKMSCIGDIDFFKVEALFYLSTSCGRIKP